MAQSHFSFQNQQNYFNPAKQHLRKVNNRQKISQQTPQTPFARITNTHKHMRFRDLSKDRPEYYTQLPKQPSQGSIKQVSRLGSIRRKLFQDSLSSREKSMSFSEVIRMSRQKKLREESRPKESIAAQQSSTRKEGRAFNALKARLMGQNNPNASNIIKPPNPHHNSIPVVVKSAVVEQMDMVRVSMQVDSSMLRQSLEMLPL